MYSIFSKNCISFIFIRETIGIGNEPAHYLFDSSFKYIINIYYYFSLQNLILEAIKQWSIRLDFNLRFVKDTKYHICTSNKIFHS